MRRFAVFCLVVALTATAAAVQQRAQAQIRPLTIAASLADMSQPFSQILAKRMQAEADKLGSVKVDIYDAKNLAAQQQTDLQTIIQKKYDGVIISPVNGDNIVGIVQTLLDADVPVVTLSRSMKGIDNLAYIGSDDVTGAQNQGQILLKQFANGAHIFILQGTAGATTATARNKGLHNILDDKPQYQIVFEHSANFNRVNAKAIVTQALKDTGVVPDAIITANDSMAFGTVDALKEQGLVGKVVVIAYGASSEMLADIQNNQILATVDQFTGKQAAIALDTITDFLWNGKRPEKHDIIVQSLVITRDNLTDSDSYPAYKASLSATAAATMADAATAVPTSAATMPAQ